MASFKDLLQNADFKQEKHVPVIEAADRIKKGSEFIVKVTVGREIAHPNTTAHHISWISLHFQPKGEKFPYQIAKVDFYAHGASAQGPDTSTVYTKSELTVSFKTDKEGTIYAISSCNIHGIWESTKDLGVE